MHQKDTESKEAERGSMDGQARERRARGDGKRAGKLGYGTGRVPGQT